MKYTEEELKKSGLKSIEISVIGRMLPTLNVTYLNGLSVSISINRSEIYNGVDGIINTFITKSILKNRKEKLKRLNEI